jgi:hypothetical protein
MKWWSEISIPDDINLKVSPDAKFHVPLNYTRVWQIVEPSDEIFYSGILNGRRETGVVKLSWTTQVILTKKGLYYTEMKTRKKNTIDIFVPWPKVKKLRKYRMTVKGDAMESYPLSIMRVRGEKKPNFQKRHQEFMNIIFPCFIQGLKDHLQYIRAHGDDKEIYTVRKEKKLMSKIAKAENNAAKLMN